MSETLVVTSLDKDLHPGVVMLGFGSKKLLFEYGGCFCYLMCGRPSKPSFDAVYGAANGRNWALSRNVRSLLDWIDAPDTAPTLKEQA